jgi:hypothetical protein
MSYTGADSVVLLNQALNADQLNIPNQNIPHLVAWNLNSNSLQYVNTLNGNIDVELFSYINSYRNYVVVDAQYGDSVVAATDPYNSAYSFSSIEDALANTQGGDLIVVNPGTYQEKNIINIDPNTGSRGFYFYPNANVFCDPNNNVIFNIDSVICNIYGYGNFNTTTIGGACFTYADSTSQLSCNSIKCEAEFSACFFADDSNIIANVKTIDCSFNLAAILIANQSTIILNAIETRYSSVAYGVQLDSNVTINVPTTICYDGVDVGGYPYISACVLVTDDDSNVVLNGNISGAGQTFDPVNVVGALTILGGILNSSIVMTGGTSFIRNTASFLNIGSSCTIRINASLINSCVNGRIGYIDNISTTYLAGRFEADYGIELNSGLGKGTIIMEYGVLKTLLGNACLDGTANPSNIDYAIYSGAANDAPVNSTDVLAGTGGSNLIVNPGVV